ncbi:selenoprotein S-like [Venturia canescens]|uniref:selenoprotein S-like n=1 Tax=Venturia canescens TaxID=32260 RepID=UPI001C9D2742|nr:selenoprotein S-like [Venturia canescens]
MEQEGVSYNPFSYLGIIWAGIASVGWYLVAVGVGLFFAAPYLEEKYTSWKQKKDEADYAAKYHKNPDLLHERLRGQEEARQRMQEKYDAAAKISRELEEKRKEEKKQEIAKLMANQDGGRRLGTRDGDASTSNNSTSSSFRNEYNPLMGDSSRGYRPPKRSCCGKGGCG